MPKIYLKLAGYDSELSGMVLATVISTNGSTPAKAGSSAIFDKSGLLYGTIGGGVLEGRVTALASEFAGSGRTGIFDFDFDKDISKTDEAICGGRASVLIDASLSGSIGIFRLILENYRKRKPCLLGTELTVTAEGETSVKRFLLDDPAHALIQNGFSDVLQPHVDRLLSSEGAEEFAMVVLKNKEGDKNHIALLEPLFPRKHLIIAGAGHIGRVLSHVANLLDFEVTVIDDRSELASRSNLPDADNIIAGNIGTTMDKMVMDHDTYVVIVTRGHKDDADALRSCINEPVAYIGMIGSRTKIEKMRRNFIENGWATQAKWDEVHAPVGIEIGSRTVEEIAISIAAELVLYRNRRKL